MEKINITISLICIGSPKNLMNLKERILPILAAMCTFFRSKYAKYFQSIVDARVYSQCLYNLQCVILCSKAKVTSSSITHFGKLFQQACHRQGERMTEVGTYLVIAGTVAWHGLQFCSKILM